MDAVLGPHGGTVLMVINAMCGGAAGRARPGIALALRHAMVPDTVATVFAGGDLAATAIAKALTEAFEQFCVQRPEEKMSYPG